MILGQVWRLRFVFGGCNLICAYVLNLRRRSSIFRITIVHSSVYLQNSRVLSQVVSYIRRLFCWSMSGASVILSLQNLWLVAVAQHRACLI
jgi:hypothetical protein